MDARELSARLSDLLRREQDALAEFLVALADFDRKRAWVELGYPSLFSYLNRELGLSKGAAFNRKTAAELIQRFPEIVAPSRTAVSASRWSASFRRCSPRGTGTRCSPGSIASRRRRPGSWWRSSSPWSAHHSGRW
jgi:hypothetical protein